jgi:hypothetical protein
MIKQFWNENKAVFYAGAAAVFATVCSILAMTTIDPKPWTMFWAMMLITFSIVVIGFEVLPHMAKRASSRFDRWYFVAQSWLFVGVGIIAIIMDIFLVWLALTH